MSILSRIVDFFLGIRLRNKTQKVQRLTKKEVKKRASEADNLSERKLNIELQIEQIKKNLEEKNAKYKMTEKMAKFNSVLYKYQLYYSLLEAKTRYYITDLDRKCKLISEEDNALIDQFLQEINISNIFKDSELESISKVGDFYRRVDGTPANYFKLQELKALFKRNKIDCQIHKMSELKSVLVEKDRRFFNKILKMFSWSDFPTKQQKEVIDNQRSVLGSEILDLETSQKKLLRQLDGVNGHITGLDVDTEEFLTGRKKELQSISKAALDVHATGVQEDVEQVLDCIDACEELGQSVDLLSAVATPRSKASMSVRKSSSLSFLSRGMTSPKRILPQVRQTADAVDEYARVAVLRSPKKELLNLIVSQIELPKVKEREQIVEKVRVLKSELDRLDETETELYIQMSSVLESTQNIPIDFQPLKAALEESLDADLPPEPIRLVF